MVFITAGMGGGTGTGAAPVIAQLAKDRDILTVGIVTIPFQFEGKVRQDQALLGVERLRKQVDSLIVINNNKLREVYGNLGFKAGFSKADEVLATASRGIAEVITHHYTQNIDLKDAKTVLSNSGTAIMGSATAIGENRAKEAIVSALDSPLLNDNKITGAKNVLLLIVSGTNEITIDEIGEINDHIQVEAGFNANIIMGVGEDETLGDSIAVTIIATGFNVEQQNDIVNTEPKKIIHSLEENQRMGHDLSPKPVVSSFDFSAPEEKKTVANTERVVFELEEYNVFDAKVEEPVKVVEEPIQQVQFVAPVAPVVPAEPVAPVSDLVRTTEFIKNIDVEFQIVSPISEHEFYITTPEVREMEVFQPEFVAYKEEEQITFSFDLPVKQEVETPREAPKQDRILFELSNETKEIQVNQPVQVVPMTELNEKGIVRYSLEEYMEVENELVQSKPAPAVEKPVDRELELTMKVETPKFNNPAFEEISPLEMTIEQTLKKRADERRAKMKEFNYKFHNNPSRVDEFEKEPAYKRMGIDLSNTQADNSKSRMSLGTDSNDDLQLRSNNSFLHDNVD